ncbi:MAG: hypothetical protein V4555_01380 [Acidobacteriota bacterium]
MPLYDQDDTFGRWLNLICAGFLALFAVGGFYMLTHGTIIFICIGGLGVLGGSIYLGYRCLRYAITGKGNVNRDNF